MDALSAAALGVVLAATAGLRAFLPVFSASLAAWTTDLPLPATLAWLERPQTVLIFGVATLLEILGDKIPVVDHAVSCAIGRRNTGSEKSPPIATQPSTPPAATMIQR